MRRAAKPDMAQSGTHGQDLGRKIARADGDGLHGRACAGLAEIRDLHVKAPKWAWPPALTVT